MHRWDTYFRTIILLGSIITLVAGCKPLSYLGTADVSNFYSSKSNPPGFNCVVYNINDSTSHAIIRFPFSSLSFLPAKKGEKASHRLIVSYSLYHSIQDNKLIDSASIIHMDTVSHPALYFSADFDITATYGSKYILQVDVIDQASDSHFMLLKPFSKITRSDASWFKLESKKKGILMENYLSYDDSIRLVATDTSIKTITCNAYFDQFLPAVPPFIIKERQPFDYKCDSTFKLYLKSGISAFIVMPHKGFYFFQSDSSATKGITYIKFYPGYPKINTPQKMIESLRYITSSKEFDQLLYSSNPKATIDSFWVATAGGPDRAVELIRAYYSRVEEANRFFSSYCEGWKTDRGIIYTIFGPPNLVNISDQEEDWTYGEANNYHSIRFTFYKVINPFTENDFVLQRQSTYRDVWYNAVQQWRR
jgi:GWxTD domain-containing protein